MEEDERTIKEQGSRRQKITFYLNFYRSKLTEKPEARREFQKLDGWEKKLLA